MRNLSIERMEQFEGGSWGDCGYLIASIAGSAASIASVPVSGPIGAWTAVGLIASAIGTAGSGIGCLDTFAPN